VPILPAWRNTIAGQSTVDVLSFSAFPDNGLDKKGEIWKMQRLCRAAADEWLKWPDLSVYGFRPCFARLRRGFAWN
jgi:hypothetical protein